MPCSRATSPASRPPPWICPSAFSAVKPGSDLVCEARVVKRGSRVLFVEASASSDNREVARATASFLLLT